MDPRVERTREHVLTCARALMAEHGADEVTFSSVGKVARVARQTLYRHWSTREHLLADVLLVNNGLAPHPLADATPEAHLRAFLQNARDHVNSPAIASATTLLMSHAATDPASADALRVIVEQWMQSLRIGWGLVSEDEYAVIVGPVIAQMLMLRRPVTEEFISQLVGEAIARRRSAVEATAS